MKSRFRCRQISWSELAPDLLTIIAERLETRADVLHFRRVCKTWRASAPLSLLTPKNILSPLFPCGPYRLTNEYGFTNSKTNNIVASSVFLLQSNVNPSLPPWLFFVDEFTKGKLSIRCPNASTMPIDFPKAMDLSRLNVLELGRFHRSTCQGNRDNYKAVLFVNPKCVTHPAINDCTLMELSQQRDMYATRLRNGEKHKIPYRVRDGR